VRRSAATSPRNFLHALTLRKNLIPQDLLNPWR